MTTEITKRGTRLEYRVSSNEYPESKTGGVRQGSRKTARGIRWFDALFTYLLTSRKSLSLNRWLCWCTYRLS